MQNPFDLDNPTAYLHWRNRKLAQLGQTAQIIHPQPDGETMIFASCRASRQHTPMSP